MIEKAVKFFFRVLLMIITLFGLRFILLKVGILIPFEWFIVMIAGMFGFYGILLLVFYAFLINIL